MDDLRKKMRNDAREIWQAALEAANATRAVKRHLDLRGERVVIGNETYDLDNYDRILAVGGGKAGAAMALGLEEILGQRLQDGRVNVKYGHGEKLERITIQEAGHPVPDKKGEEGTRTIARLAERADEGTLLFCLISGGASALLPLPASGISLRDKQEVTRLLLASGASIEEFNAVRKHISALKGGQLARLAAPAQVLTLIISDVIGDRLDTIASGPTVPDNTTFAECLDIITRFHLEEDLPRSIMTRLRKGERGEIPETPKVGDPAFARVANIIIASNRQALRAASEKAREIGYRAEVTSSELRGETRDVACQEAKRARRTLEETSPGGPPICLLSGGETTVTVKGDGQGGRNQEFVLAASREIAGAREIVLMSGGTDGTDGPTEAAGAIADGDTVQRARELALRPEQFLQHNDSYPFFAKLGDLVVTGPTKTNVMDIHLFLIARPEK